MCAPNANILPRIAAGQSPTTEGIYMLRLRMSLTAFRVSLVFSAKDSWKGSGRRLRNHGIPESAVGVSNPTRQLLETGLPVAGEIMFLTFYLGTDLFGRVDVARFVPVERSVVFASALCSTDVRYKLVRTMNATSSTYMYT